MGRIATLAAAIACASPWPAVAQAPPANQTGEAVRITPGARYDRGSFFRALFGERYRDVEGAAWSGVHLTTLGRVVPGTWDVGSTFGTLDGVVSAFLTGSHRFAGDASLSGSVELRQPLARFSIILPQDVGVSLIADAGRVWLDGESPGGWHTGFGGGAWISFQDLLGSSLSLEVMGSEERTAFHFGMGFAF